MFDFDSFEGRLPWHQSKWDPAALESQFGCAAGMDRRYGLQNGPRRAGGGH